MECVRARVCVCGQFSSPIGAMLDRVVQAGRSTSSRVSSLAILPGIASFKRRPRDLSGSGVRKGGGARGARATPSRLKNAIVRVVLLAVHATCIRVYIMRVPVHA